MKYYDGLYENTDLLDDVALIALTSSNEIVNEKGKNDIVTNGDLKVDEVLRQELVRLDSEAIFLTEETCDPEMVKNKDFQKIFINNAPHHSVWVVDPIDGTGNYARDGYDWGTLIARVKGNHVCDGAIILPKYGDFIVSKPDGKSDTLKSAINRNGRQCMVSNQKDLSKAAVGMEPTSRDGLRDYYLPLLEKLAHEAGEWRNYGSGAVSLYKLITGEIDACVIPGYSWDMCPGKILVEAAGGYVCQLDGKPWEPWSKDGLFTATKELQNQILKVVNG